MFPLNDILLSAAGAALVAAAALYSSLKWSRQRYRFLVISLSTFLGFGAWNILQSATGADQSLNVDWPVFPLSWADVGSGAAAFVFTAVALGLLTERGESASHVVTAAAIAAVMATLVDLFVL